jgi:single-stranded-DNA-specific exonuclease
MLEEANAQAEQVLERIPAPALLLVSSEQWHKGIVGLVASRLVERFRRPACAIAWEGDEGTGSLRSINGVDIGAAVRAALAAGHLKKGGGHAMAAGLTLARPLLETLEGFLAARLESTTRAACAAAALEIDGALTPASVTDELLELLERAGPYGQGNPAPRFAFPAHRVRFAKPVGGAHVRCVLEASDGMRLDAVAFRAADQPVGTALLAAAGMPLHIAGHLRRESWGGRDRRELVIEDVADPRQQG